MATHSRVHQTNLARDIKFSVFAVLLSLGVSSQAQGPSPELLPAFPESAFLESDERLSPEFCEKWNPEFFPEFTNEGFKCCSHRQFWSSIGNASASSSSSSRRGRRRSRGAPFCAPGRNGFVKCGERTPEQVQYEESIQVKIATKTLGEREILDFIEGRLKRQVTQSFCSPSNGFVVDALPLVPTPTNRLLLNAEDRCANYGTDHLAYLGEWLGNEIHKEYSEEEFQNAKLILGDAGAPKGGCLAVRRGRRGHRSHTNGQDIDIAFFNPRPLNERQVISLRHYRDETKSVGVPEEVLPSRRFTTDMYVASNWWLLKKMYSSENQYACVRSIFLDRRHKDRLARYATSIGEIAEWSKISDYISHEKGHFHHFHLRVVPKARNGVCLSLNELKRKVEDEYRRTGKRPDLKDWGLGDSGDGLDDPELYDEFSENQALQGVQDHFDAEKSDEAVDEGENGQSDAEAPLESVDAPSDSENTVLGKLRASQPSAKASDEFLKSQKEILKAEVLDREAKVAEAEQNAIAKTGVKLLPDHKREPMVSNAFPVRGKGKIRRSKRRGARSSVRRNSSKAIEEAGKRSPASVKSVNSSRKKKSASKKRS